MHRVQPGEELWGLAERYYGDGTAWRLIAAANPDVLTGGPDLLHPGWELIIPGLAATGPEEVSVQSGDTLSGLAEDHLGDADRWGEVYQVNLDRLSDPDQVGIGQVLRLPAAEGQGPGGVDSPPSDERSGEGEGAEQHPGPGAETPTPPPSQDDGPLEGPAVPAPAPAPAPTSPAPTPGPGETSLPPAPEPTPHPGPRSEAGPGSGPTAGPGPDAEPTEGPGPVPGPGEGNGPGPGPGEGDGPGPAEDPERLAVAEPAADQLARVGVLGGTGGLLAAAVVAGVMRRRAVQLATRPPGRQLPVPALPAQGVRAALTQHQEAPGLDQLAGLQRTVAAHCRALGVEVPALERAVVSAERIVLLHEGLALPVPAGLHAGTETVLSPDGTVRELARWELQAGGQQAAGVSGPPGPVDDLADRSHPVDVAWPSLVALGEVAEGNLLVCLQRLGMTVVASPDPAVAVSAVTALVMQLGCSGWAEQLGLTVVGPVGADVARSADLPLLQLDEDAEQMVDRLEQRWQRQRAGGEPAGVRRLHASADTAWNPDVVVLSRALEPSQWDRLGAVVAGGAPVAVVAVGAAVPPWASARLQLAPDGRSARWEQADRAPQRFRPQLVPTEVEGAVAELLRCSSSTETTPAPWWQPRPTAPREHPGRGYRDAGPAPDVEDQQPGPRRALPPPGVPPGAVVTPLPARSATRKETEPVLPSPTETLPGLVAPRRAEPWARGGADGAAAPGDALGPTVRLLGEVELVGARGAAPSRARGQCVEYCAWLLENPGRTASAMAASLVVAEGTRRSNMSRLRTWLGHDDQGRPYLPEAYSGRIELHPEVASDVDEVRALLGGGVERARTEVLQAVLELARGAPLADAAPGQWGWAEELRVEMLCTLRDVAVVLSRRALAEGDLGTARWAAARGLAICPQDEHLLVARLRTEHQAGARTEVERLARTITRNARVLGVDLDPDTVQALQEVVEGRVRPREA